MHVRNRFALLAGAVLLSGSLITGTAFATAAPTEVRSPVQAEQRIQPHELTAGEKEILTQLKGLRKSYWEKFSAESKQMIEQGVKTGKITQEQADRMLKHGHMHGKGRKDGAWKSGR